MEKCKPVKRNETITHVVWQWQLAHTHMIKKKKQFNIPPPFLISLFGLFLLGLRLAWVRVFHFVLFWIFCAQRPSVYAQGKFKKSRLSTGFPLCRSNSPLGWLQRRFCNRPKVSGREARRGSLSYANSNFNGKMHSSNSFEFGFLADHREKANWRSYSKVGARI